MIRNNLQLLSSLIFSLTILAAHQADAQKDFVPGYVLVGTDTLKGQVQTRSLYWQINELKMKKASGEVVTYALSTLNGFGINPGVQEVFVIAEVDIDMKPVQTSMLDADLTKKIEKRRLPLKVLLKGKLNLLYYLDENRKQHFFYKNAAGIGELAYVRFNKDGRLVEFEEYRQQLKNLFADCPQISTALGSYSESYFVKVFKKYNECMGQTFSVSKKEKLRIIPGVLAGFAAQSMSFQGPDNYSIGSAEGATYNSGSGFVGGLTFDLKTGMRRKSFGLALELLYNTTSKFTGINHDFGTVYYFDFTYTTTNAVVKYSFLKDKVVSPYLKAGAGVGYLMHLNNSMNVVQFGKVIDTVSPIVDLNSLGGSFMAGAGVNFSNFAIEARYQATGWGTPSAPTKVNVGAMVFMVGYRFKN